MIGFTLGLFLRARKALNSSVPTDGGGGGGYVPTYYILGF
jgi:hypothetical protein